MDIVLEVVDTFVGDRIWASVLPAPHLQAGPGSNVTAPLTSWEYKPTSPRFYFEPSQYAYESAWARDYVFRQAVSLFFITWCVKSSHRSPSPMVWPIAIDMPANILSGSLACLITSSSLPSPISSSLIMTHWDTPSFSRTRSGWKSSRHPLPCPVSVSAPP